MVNSRARFEASRKKWTYVYHLLHDSYENRVLTVKYWMDYTDNGMEGKWVSFSTGKSDYSNWFKGEPNNKRGKQHCALNNHGKRGFWDDGTCSYQRQFTCEASGRSNNSIYIKYDDFCFKFHFILEKNSIGTGEVAISFSRIQHVPVSRKKELCIIYI